MADDKPIRLTVEVSPSLHQRLKDLATADKRSLMRFIEAQLEKIAAMAS